MRKRSGPQRAIHRVLERLHDTDLWADYLPRIPGWLYALALLGLTLFVLGFEAFRHGLTLFAWMAFGVSVSLTVPLIPVGLLIRWRASHRLNVRRRILDSIPWRGDERVLDVGCGSGLLLNGAALRLKKGKAVGIDLWSRHGGGGSSDLLWRNAALEGVADRIEVRAVDARHMPFESEAFDVVLSSGAMHHISRTHDDFARAMGEMVRVLKPGGQIVIWDVAHMVRTCTSRIESAGFKCEVEGAGQYLNYDMSIVYGTKAV